MIPEKGTDTFKDGPFPFMESFDEIPGDPSLKDLNLFWESQFWEGSKQACYQSARAYDRWLMFFRPDRKPRDIFRWDVACYKDWMRKRGYKDSTIVNDIHLGSTFYQLLDKLEFVELGFNPFARMAPRRIRLRRSKS